MSNRKLENWIKDSVEHVETQPSAQVWEALSSKLGAQAAAGSAASGAAATGAAGAGTAGWIAAAVVALGVVGATVYFTSESEPVSQRTEQSDQPVVELEKKEVEQEEVLPNTSQETEQKEKPAAKEIPNTIAKTIPTNTAPEEVEIGLVVADEQESGSEALLMDTKQQIPAETAETTETPSGSDTVSTVDESAVMSNTTLNEEVNPEAPNQDEPTAATAEPVDTEEETEDVVLEMPNIFTPANSAFYNDVFEPLPAGMENIESYELLIFSEMGQLIWQATESNQGWDGTLSSGDTAPTGWYLYKVNYTTKFQQTKQASNRVRLQR